MTEKRLAAGGVPEPEPVLVPEARIDGRVGGTIQWLRHHYRRGKRGKGVAWSRNSEFFVFQLLYEVPIMKRRVIDLIGACGRVQRGWPFVPADLGEQQQRWDPWKHAQGPRAAANNSPLRRGVIYRMTRKGRDQR